MQNLKNVLTKSVYIYIYNLNYFFISVSSFYKMKGHFVLWLDIRVVLLVHSNHTERTRRQQHKTSLALH